MTGGPRCSLVMHEGEGGGDPLLVIHDFLSLMIEKVHGSRASTSPVGEVVEKAMRIVSPSLEGFGTGDGIFGGFCGCGDGGGLVGGSAEYRFHQGLGFFVCLQKLLKGGLVDVHV